jgi:hypothetical protein
MTSDQYAFFFATCNSKALELMWHIVVGAMAEIIIIWSGTLDYMIVSRIDPSL